MVRPLQNSESRAPKNVGGQRFPTSPHSWRVFVGRRIRLALPDPAKRREVVVNLGKHVKGPVEEWTFADSNLVPSRARSAHIVGHYIKDRKRRYSGSHPDAARGVPFLLRLEGFPAYPATRTRIERQIREANRQSRLANVPVRAKIMNRIPTLG
jgi:hypothetical protein